jgi:serine/threonine-protein kinase
VPPLALDAAPAGLSIPAPPAVPGYEVLEVLGRGGMGVVYKARQLALDRLVALKVILAGPHASAEDVARFRREAEAVARLQHPHIVQIHEVGEHAGLPYFSLEYCDGGSLAARAKGAPLPARQAAQLVETLARAMHAAHQRGIVHRDLKPANVLFTADGVAKVTDFGLAKRLDDTAPQTATGAIVGTPSYMAPEQAWGKKQPVGPAADVYALGAVLYELLTGRPPFNAETPLDTVRQVMDEEPVSPRLVQPRTPRDLETICLKCLEKQPARRYASAEALADDLARFLRDEPITARPAGALERLGRWCRRNPKVAVLLTALAVVLVAGSTAVTALWLLAEDRREAAEQSLVRAESQQRRAEKQQSRAEAHLRKARAAVDKLTRVADEYLRPVPHMDKVRRRLLLEALQLDRQFLEEESDDPGVRRETALTHRRVGTIHTSLGDWKEAENHYRQAVRGFRKLTKDYPNKPDYRHELARELHNLGWLWTATQPRRAEAALGQARDLLEPLTTRLPGVPDYRESLARVHYQFGQLLHAQSGLGEAEAAYRRALRLQEELAAAHPRNPKYHDRLAATCYSLAMLNMRRGQLSPAQQLVERATRHERRAVAADPLHKDYRRFLAMQYQLAAAILKRQQQYPRAEATYQRARSLMERLAQDYPAMPEHPSRLGAVLNDLAIVQVIQHKDAEARRSIEQAITHQTAATRMNPKNFEYRRYQRHHYWNLASLLLLLGDHAAAAQAAAQLPQIVPGSQEYADAASFCADCAEGAEKDARLSERTRPAVVRQYAERVREFLKKAVDRGQGNLAAQNRLAWHLATMPPAFRNPVRALELAGQATNKDPGNGPYWTTLGAARYRVGDWTGAVAAIQKAMALLSGGDSYNWFFLAMANQRLGRKQEARKWYAQGTRWMDSVAPYECTLRRLRAEAAALLQIKN